MDALAALKSSSTTCLNLSRTRALIGSDVLGRPWVRYELLKSFVRGNSLLGIHINNIKGQNQQT